MILRGGSFLMEKEFDFSHAEFPQTPLKITSLENNYFI